VSVTVSGHLVTACPVRTLVVLETPGPNAACTQLTQSSVPEVLTNTLGLPKVQVRRQMRADTDGAMEWTGGSIVDMHDAELSDFDLSARALKNVDSVHQVHPARAVFLTNAAAWNSDARASQERNSGASWDADERDFVNDSSGHQLNARNRPRHHSRGRTLYPDYYVPKYTTHGRSHSRIGAYNPLPRGRQTSADYFSGIPDTARALSFLVSAMADMDTRLEGGNDRRGGGDRGGRNRGNKRRRDGEAQAFEARQG
jgi:hypothetical protein